MKFSLDMAQGLPRNRGERSGDRRGAQPHRPGGRRGGGSGRTARRVPRRRGADRRAASRCRQAAGADGQHRARASRCRSSAARPNARAGMKGVLGLPGAVVPANGMELRKSAIRGVEMQRHDVLGARARTGRRSRRASSNCPRMPRSEQSFAEYHGASPVFDVAVTPNRPDCMGVQGIARDLAAAGLGTFKPYHGRGRCRQLPVPGRNPHRRSGGLPGLLRPRDRAA